MSGALVIADSLSVRTIAESLINLMIDVLAQKMDRAIDKQEVRPTNVLRPESPADVPVVWIRTSLNFNERGCDPAARCKIVNRDDCGRVEISDAVCRPESASVMVVACRKDFTHMNRV